MTVSIETTTLSSVITGWGLNETTCSRRSTISRIRSTKGTTIARPALSVREYRPKRSTTPALAWGTIRIVRARTTTTKSATKRSTISSAIADLLPVDERRGALDLDHLDASSRLVDAILHESARRPLFTADSHAAAVRVDGVQDDRARSDQRGRARAEHRRHPDVAPREWPQHEDRSDRDEDECDELYQDAQADQREDGGYDRGNRHRPEEEETRREDLADRQQD